MNSAHNATLAIVALLALGATTNQAQSPAANARVQLGVDRLITLGFEPLNGKRVGLVTNPTGVASDLRSTIDILHEEPSVMLVALYGPEHGVRGEAHAGAHVADATDEITGLPIRSLYGKNRVPTAELLADIDMLVFDIQDIGSRSYTYISTMAAAMQGAVDCGKPFVVLDRPNPLTGNKVEGRPADMEFKSFVSYLPVPYVHGMTVGELAQMINGEGWLRDGKECDLHILKMDGWTRDMWFDQTGLHWVPTSPHVPRAESSLFYASTGIMGELGVVSEGVGYPLPFELAGAPFINPQRLADELNARKLPGVYFRPAYFQAYYAHYPKETCGGVQIHFTDRSRVELTPIQFHIMDATVKLYPDTNFFGGKRNNMFDKVCGTDQVRKLFMARRPIEDVLKVWDTGVDEFRRQRQKYLLYK